MQRTFAVLLTMLLAATADAAVVRFVSPLMGGQAVGPTALEIETDIAAVDRVEFYVDGSLVGVARKAPYRVAHDFGTSTNAREIVAKVFSNGYKTIDTAKVTTMALTAGEAIDVDLVEVPLRVRSAKKLAAGDLRVRENGVEQTVREVRAERGPAHFAFVIDRSLSMGNGKLAAALRAVDGELRQLREGDTASVILFNHHVAKARAIGRGERVAAMFQDVQPSGGTSLRDAVSAIPSRQRTYAIVITDGGDRNSILSDEEALRRISGTKTILAALVLGESHAKFLDAAAKNTGGTIVEASAATLQTKLRELLADINSRYLVVYQSSGTGKGWRTIAIAPKRSGVEIVNARKVYFAS